jgi:DNA-binding response OmpR family regulator
VEPSSREILEQEILEIAMKRRILLVDDEVAILLTLKAILDMNGFEVETAASAREAEQKLGSGTFEMVITDMCMEKADSGFEVIRAARRQAYNPATAILTAYPMLGGDWKSEGAQSLLVKPMNTGDLLRQIEALLVTHQDSKAEGIGPEIVKAAPQRAAAMKGNIRKAV